MAEYPFVAWTILNKKKVSKLTNPRFVMISENDRHVFDYVETSDLLMQDTMNFFVTRPGMTRFRLLDGNKLVASSKYFFFSNGWCGLVYGIDARNGSFVFSKVQDWLYHGPSDSLLANSRLKSGVVFSEFRSELFYGLSDEELKYEKLKIGFDFHNSTRRSCDVLGIKLFSDLQEEVDMKIPLPGCNDIGSLMVKEENVSHIKPIKHGKTVRVVLQIVNNKLDIWCQGALIAKGVALGKQLKGFSISSKDETYITNFQLRRL